MKKQLVGSRTRDLLGALGYPAGDDYSLPDSAMEFAGGGQFGIEISSINNADTLQSLLRLSDAAGVRIDRVDECRGIFRLPDPEIRLMVSLCRDRQIGLFMSLGPRAIYDTGGFVKTTNGGRIGYRLRGMESVVHALEDMSRALDHGVRGFLIYDEGLLQIASRMRDRGSIPSETVLKLSVHACCANAASARLMSDTGADTINLVPDLDLAMISAIRKATQCPLDLFTDTAADAGGMIRTYETPEFIRIASPVYLKCGSVSQQNQNHLASPSELAERVKQTRRVIETIERYYPEAKRVGAGERTLAIPPA